MRKSRTNKAQSVSIPWIQSMGWLQWHKEEDLETNNDINHAWNVRSLARFLDFYIEKGTGYQPYKPEEYMKRLTGYQLENSEQQKHALRLAKSRLGELCNNAQYKLLFQRMGIEETKMDEWQS